MHILIGGIVAFFVGAALPGNSPISLAGGARYDTWLCVRE
jgi:hypothetical protein